MVNIATMGLFSNCCSGIGGGGAVPTYRDDEKVVPLVRVLKVEATDIDVASEISKKLHIKLVDDLED